MIVNIPFCLDKKKIISIKKIIISNWVNFQPPLLSVDCVLGEQQKQKGRLLAKRPVKNQVDNILPWSAEKIDFIDDKSLRLFGLSCFLIHCHSIILLFSIDLDPFFFLFLFLSCYARLFSHNVIQNMRGKKNDSNPLI